MNQPFSSEHFADLSLPKPNPFIATDFALQPQMRSAKEARDQQQQLVLQSEEKSVESHTTTTDSNQKEDNESKSSLIPPNYKVLIVFHFVMIFILNCDYPEASYLRFSFVFFFFSN
jgi:hypothetical protein